MSPTRPTTTRIVATLSMLVVLLALFTAAFIWQVSRAVGGNSLSWAYVAEWPVLGAYACYFAYRDLTGTRKKKPASVASDRRAAAEAEALARYNEMLALQRDPSATPLAGEDSNP